MIDEKELAIHPVVQESLQHNARVCRAEGSYLVDLLLVLNEQISGTVEHT